MKINKEYFIEVLSKVEDCSKDVLDSDKINDFKNQIVTKLDNLNPTLMVYGTYNAGKSTLINALFGEEELAKTGDVPETNKINSYEYNGYVIYDTPGINAPIEHEEVTSEHLKKCELILFVMSNDGSFEEEYVYEKIIDIIKNNKPILIALNNKKSIDVNSKDAINEINKINENLLKVANKYDVKDIKNKVSLCIVNAKTALKGKIDNKNSLLESSNMEQFENMINVLLKESGEKEVFNGLNSYIADFTTSLMEKIDSQIDNEALKKTEELITYLEKEKAKIKVDFKNEKVKSLNILEGSLSSGLHNNNSDINRILEEHGKTLESNFLNIYNDCKNDIIDKTNQSMNEIKIIINQDAVDVSMPNIKAQDTNNSGIDKNKVTIISNAASAIVANTPIPQAKIIAGFIMLAGPLLSAVFSDTENDRRNAQAEAEANAEKKIELAIKNKVDELIYKQEGNLNTVISSMIKDLFSDISKHFNELKNSLNVSNKNLLDKKEILLDILNKA